MKNFQIFLQGGKVRYAAADKVEVGGSQVVLYSGERIVATYDKSSVIMLDEFEIRGVGAGGDYLKRGFSVLQPVGPTRRAGGNRSGGPPEAA